MVKHIKTERFRYFQKIAATIKAGEIFFAENIEDRTVDLSRLKRDHSSRCANFKKIVKHQTLLVLKISLPLSKAAAIFFVENIGVEPMTSCVQGRRSSQLS